MITRMTGTIREAAALAVTLEVGEGGLWYEVLVPAYVGESAAARVGERITLVTLQYLEGQGQGSSFIPRLIGFEKSEDRKFFELFTTVKGIGNRKALRAMALPPATIARAIADRNARALTELPEIGKRLAETVIAELHGKVDGYLALGEVSKLDRAIEPRATIASGPVEEAVAALLALGEQRADAERLVARAGERLAKAGTPAESADELVSAVFAARGS